MFRVPKQNIDRQMKVFLTQQNKNQTKKKQPVQLNKEVKREKPKRGNVKCTSAAAAAAAEEMKRI